MHYYHRYLENGKCEIICTHCFLTIGTAGRLLTIKKLEGEHVCALPPALTANHAGGTLPRASIPQTGWLAVCSEKLASLPLPLLLLAVPILLYALPTALEMAVSTGIDPWVTGIVLGDLAACACIYIIFRMPKTGVLLYLLLAVVKFCLFSAQLISANTLLWFTDSIPALIVMARIASLRLHSTEHTLPRT